MKRLTVHLIGNAHIDPVWMWTWPAGVDEALNTCRTACDMLDEYPELIITRGEGWVHEQIRLIDPELFSRIRKHAENGRWGAVNGWWVQADCNLPSARGFIRQGTIATSWFKEHLGVDVTAGYQVDSFGHTAMMPSFLNAAGLKYYTFARPTPQVWDLPAELFRWQAADGAEVIVQRIPVSYCARSIEQLQRNIDAAISIADRDVGHVMAFYGIGDHGGGPSRQQVEWLLEHMDYSDDITLEFSHPGRFFETVEALDPELPIYRGEMQFVSPGSYSVMDQFTREVRAAEQLLSTAEDLTGNFSEYAPQDFALKIEDAWKQVLFNHFHDTLAGTSIEPAYTDGRDQLGYAKSIARDIIVQTLRKMNNKLEPCPQQRLVLRNTSAEPFQGVITTEPWLGAEAHELAVRYTDPSGRELPIQKIPGHAAEMKMARYLIPMSFEPFEERIVQIHHDKPAQVLEPCASFKDNTLDNGPLAIITGDTGITAIQRNGQDVLGKGGIRISVQEDHSNTWGSGANAPYFDGPVKGDFKTIDPWKLISHGSLRTMVSGELVHDQSRIMWRVFLDQDQPIVRMSVRVIYNGVCEILKLIVPPVFKASSRRDGTPGSRINRPLDGAEYPVYEHITVSGENRHLTVVSPDIYAADVQADGTMRLTLMRSPHYVHNGNFPETKPDHHLYPVTGQGEHRYQIALIPALHDAVDMIAEELQRMRKPVWISESTKGMPPRHHEVKVETG